MSKNKLVRILIAAGIGALIGLIICFSQAHFPNVWKSLPGTPYYIQVIVSTVLAAGIAYFWSNNNDVDSN
jgi:ABC-type antimicrobial peptide transport system permease subunit